MSAKLLSALKEPLPVLSLGDRGEAVSKLRQLFAKCDRCFGVPGILVSDTFDSQLEAIVRIFQYQVFLFQDGIVGPKTLSALQADTPTHMPTIQLGDQNMAVFQSQTRLKRYGNYPIVVDGDFDEKTRQAVLEFQKGQKLTMDGIIGPMTWHRLSQV